MYWLFWTRGRFGLYPKGFWFDRRPTSCRGLLLFQEVMEIFRVFESCICLLLDLFFLQCDLLRLSLLGLNRLLSKLWTRSVLSRYSDRRSWLGSKKNSLSFKYLSWGTLRPFNRLSICSNDEWLLVQLRLVSEAVLLLLQLRYLPCFVIIKDLHSIFDSSDVLRELTRSLIDSGCEEIFLDLWLSLSGRLVASLLPMQSLGFILPGELSDRKLLFVLIVSHDFEITVVEYKARLSVR